MTLTYLAEYKVFGPFQLLASQGERSDLPVNQISTARLEISAGNSHRLRKRFALKSITLPMALSFSGIVSSTQQSTKSRFFSMGSIVNQDTHCDAPQIWLSA